MHFSIVTSPRSYVARTQVQVSNTITYLRVRFVNSQNLKYEDTNDKYPKFGYGCGGVFDKNKEILYLRMNHIYGQLSTT